jgi:NADPH:quinone reductase
MRKSLTFTRRHIGHLDFFSPAWAEGAPQVIEGTASGTITVPIEGVYSFEQVHDMFAQLGSRQVAVKLLLKIGG